MNSLVLLKVINVVTSLTSLAEFKLKPIIGYTIPLRTMLRIYRTTFIMHSIHMDRMEKNLQPITLLYRLHITKIKKKIKHDEFFQNVEYYHLNFRMVI